METLKILKVVNKYSKEQNLYVKPLGQIRAAAINIEDIYHDRIDIFDIFEC